MRYKYSSATDYTNKAFGLEQKQHESKPVRAALAGVGSWIPQIGGLALGLAQSPLSLAEYGIRKLAGDENAGANALKHNVGLQISAKGTELVHDLVGANQPENQDWLEKTTAFVPELVAWQKMPLTAATKAVGRKTAQKVFKNTLQKQLQDQTSKAVRKGILLRNAKSSSTLGTARDAALQQYDKIQNRLGFVMPGIQTTPSKHLKQYYKGKGLSPEQITQAVRNKKIKEIVPQAGFALGGYELGNYLGKEQGIFADYSEKDMDFSQEQRMDQSILDNVLPTVITGAALIGGYKYLNAATKSNLDKVASQNADILADNKLSRELLSNTDPKLSRNITANLADRTNIAGDPAFSKLFTPDIEANLRQDVSSHVNRQWNTGEVGYGIDNGIPFAKHNMELQTLSQTKPEMMGAVDELLRIDSNLQEYALDYNRNMFSGGYKDIDKFLSTDEILQQTSDRAIRDLLRKRNELIKQIRTDSQGAKLLDDISKIDQVLLEANKKAGIVNALEVDFLKKNRTVGGFFSYVRRVGQADDPSIIENVKDAILGKNVTDLRAKDTDIMRKGYTYRSDLRTRRELFEQDTKSLLRELDINSIKKDILPKMLENQFNWTKDYDKSLKALVKAGETEEADRLVEQLANATRIKFLGKTNFRNDVPHQPSKNMYSLLNKPISEVPSITKAVSFKATSYTDVGSFSKKIDNRALKKNIVSYFDENGDEFVFEVSPLLGKALDFSPEVSGAIGNAAKVAKNIMQSLTTGVLNPGFAATSAIYSTMEGLTALPKIMKDLMVGDFKKVSDSLGYIKATVKAGKERISKLMTEDLINTWEQEYTKYNGNVASSKILQKYSQADIEAKRSALNKLFLSKAEEAGAITHRIPTETVGRFYEITPEMTTTTKFMNLIRQKYGMVRGTTAIKMIGFVQEALRNAGNDGLLLFLAGKKHVETLPELQQLSNVISKNITDSSKLGNFSGLGGELVGGIAKYTPYGQVFVKSIAAKTAASGVGNGIEFLKTASKQLKNSDTKVIDVLTQLKIGTEALKNNAFIQGLIVTAGFPAIISYLWNHKDAETRNSYYQISDYDKASKFILADFFGEGRHLSMPFEQEVGIVAKVVETLLDTELHGSRMQYTDPAFQHHKLIMQAMARSLNIENLVYPELLLNAAGYQSNFGVGDSSVISPLPPNQKNIDGSETALQNGVFSQQSRAMINTIFGSLGTTLANSIEQGHIGTRDVGFAQGTKDFLSSFGTRMTKGIPFMPNDNKFTYRASNQTQQQNKLKQNTIDKLRKLRNFEQNIGAFGRRSGNKLMNEAQIQTIPAELQLTKQIADVAVPMFNERIAPLFERVSSTYKQIATYNATGRDRFGNVVDASDRFEYQQNKNREIQKLHEQIYREFEQLEYMLTNQFGRDITLIDFDELKGV